MILISRAYIPCEPWRGIFLHSRFDSAHIWGQNRAERGQIRYQRAAEYFTRKLFRLCLDCFNHTNIGECRKKHWQSLQIHELRTNLILVNISLQSWIRVFFNQVKKSYLKKQAKKLRFLPLLIGLWTKYCSAGDGVWWQSILKTIYASVLNALLVMCPFLIWTQRQTETTWDHQAHPPTRRPLLNFKWRCLYPAGSLSKSPPLEPEIYDQFVNRQILPSDTK